MYESSFGFSASPFQLSPDPSFYFESKGHGHALAYLRYGAYQGEGFIVVTGEIGAGKTTLVRALLSELDPAKVVAAQLVSTQLEAGDLLKSILTAFGIKSPTNASKATLIASLEAYLTLLAMNGRRALLIVDEAQNLGREAVEELRMLSNFQLEHHALLQSFLIGQPELRQLLQSDSMEQLRQRVIASCHLGPLDAEETRAYIEHRLRRVGWDGRPHFEPGTLDAVHRASGGIPRRINLLCSRLLLGASLSGSEEIGLALAEQAIQEMRQETGDAAERPAPARAATVAPPLPREAAESPFIRRYREPGVEPIHPVLFVAETALDWLKCRALGNALDELACERTPVYVAAHAAAEFAGEDTALQHLDAPVLEVDLGVPSRDGAERTAAVLGRFDRLLLELAPCAVVLVGHGDGALACALAARKRDLPVVRIDAGAQVPEIGAAEVLNAGLIDQLASLLVTSRVSAHATLIKRGAAAERVLCLGSLVLNVVHLQRDCAPTAAEVLQVLALDLTPKLVDAPFGVMTLAVAPGDSLGLDAVIFLESMRKSVPVLWMVDAATETALRSAGLVDRLRKAQVAIVPWLNPLGVVSLIAAGTWLVCGRNRALADVAEALGVPCIELAAGTAAAKHARRLCADLGSTRRSAAEWDGGPARRMAEEIRRLAT